jgi:hypothetical protein
MKLNGKYCISLQFMQMILIQWVEAYTLQKNTDASAVTTKETGLEVNADTTKYMVSS